MCFVVSPHFARAERTSYCVNEGNSCQISSIQVVRLSPLTSCSKYPICKFSPSSQVPEIAGISPRILFNNVVFPIPLAPTRAIFCPLSIERDSGFDNGSSYPITRSFVSKIYLPGVLPYRNLNSGFGRSAASSITSILSSFFCLDIAIFLVETRALFLATKSFNSLISCCCLL